VVLTFFFGLSVFPTFTTTTEFDSYK
jgi:hypothetical protein